MGNKNVMNSRGIHIESMKVVPINGRGSITLTFFNGIDPITGIKIERPEVAELVLMNIISMLAVANCHNFSEMTYDSSQYSVEHNKPVLISAMIDEVNEWLFSHGGVTYTSKGWNRFQLPEDIHELCKQPYLAIQDGQYCVNLRYFIAEDYV